jgi:hypothetical protein
MNSVRDCKVRFAHLRLENNAMNVASGTAIEKKIQKRHRHERMRRSCHFLKRLVC